MSYDKKKKEVQEELLKHLSKKKNCTCELGWKERNPVRGIAYGAETMGKQALWGPLDVWFDTKPQDSCLTVGV